MPRLATAVATCLTLAALNPQAATAETTLEQLKAAYKSGCIADVKKLCSAAEKGEKSACLKARIKEASMACREARKAYGLALKKADKFSKATDLE